MLIIRTVSISALKSMTRPSSRQKANIGAKIITKKIMINIKKNSVSINKHAKSNSIRRIPISRKIITTNNNTNLKKKRLVATSSKKDHRFAMYVKQIYKSMRSIFIRAIANIKYAISAIRIKLKIMKESALIVISTTKFREWRNINKVDLQKIRHWRNSNFKKIRNYINEMRTRI